MRRRMTKTPSEPPIPRQTRTRPRATSSGGGAPNRAERARARATAPTANRAARTDPARLARHPRTRPPRAALAARGSTPAEGFRPTLATPFGKREEAVVVGSVRLSRAGHNLNCSQQRKLRRSTTPTASVRPTLTRHERAPTSRDAIGTSRARGVASRRVDRGQVRGIDARGLGRVARDNCAV